MRDRLTIERPTVSDEIEGAGSDEWETVAENVPAEVQDMLPSRAERLENGVNISERPARVRMRFRTDVKPNMRFVMGERIMEIIGGPAELGHREGLEFVVRDFGTA